METFLNVDSLERDISDLPFYGNFQLFNLFIRIETLNVLILILLIKWMNE